MIPKIIHYCWFGNNPLPKDVKKCIASWKKYCPDYKIVQWNEKNFDVQSHPFTKSAYDAKVWAFVSDYARLRVVYDNGGIYLDTDVELLKPLDALLVHSCYVGIQQCEKLCTTGLGFDATKFHPVVYRMMEEYGTISFTKEDKNITCPCLNNKVFAKLEYTDKDSIQIVANAVIYPPKYFDPLAPGKGMEDLLCKETFSIHHYSASWTPLPNRFRRRLLRIIGQKNVNLLKKILNVNT